MFRVKQIQPHRIHSERPTVAYFPIRYLPNAYAYFLGDVFEREELMQLDHHALPAFLFLAHVSSTVIPCRASINLAFSRYSGVLKPLASSTTKPLRS